jgi:hypothetical protein
MTSLKTSPSLSESLSKAGERWCGAVGEKRPAGALATPEKIPPASSSTPSAPTPEGSRSFPDSTAGGGEERHKMFPAFKALKSIISMSQRHADQECGSIYTRSAKTSLCAIVVSGGRKIAFVRTSSLGPRLEAFFRYTTLWPPAHVRP